MVLLRRQLGDTLRSRRQRQSRTLRDVSNAARVSLGYLSEVERGHKEASSELLAAICEALDVRLADVLREVSDGLDRAEVSVAPPAPRPLGPTTLAEVIPAPERPASEDGAPSVAEPVPAAGRAAAREPGAGGAAPGCVTAPECLPVASGGDLLPGLPGAVERSPGRAAVVAAA